MISKLITSFILIGFSVCSQAQSPMKYPSGRIAISHDGNNYDKDDYVAAAMNLALIEGLGLKSKLVYFDHSCHLVNKTVQYDEMLESVDGAVKRFDIDSSVVFDIQTQLDEAIAKFKIEAEKSSAKNPLWFCIGGPMELPWRCINAVDPTKRKFIRCISHSSPFNEEHVAQPRMTHTWDDIGALGVDTIRIKNQNRTEWNTKKENVLWMKNASDPNLQWLYSRNVKKTFDSSDSGMLWWLITGAHNGGNSNGGWQDYKAVLESISSSKKD